MCSLAFLTFTPRYRSDDAEIQFKSSGLVYSPLSFISGWSKQWYCSTWLQLWKGKGMLQDGLKQILSQWWILLVVMFMSCGRHVRAYVYKLSRQFMTIREDMSWQSNAWTQWLFTGHSVSFVVRHAFFKVMVKISFKIWHRYVGRFLVRSVLWKLMICDAFLAKEP